MTFVTAAETGTGSSQVTGITVGSTNIMGSNSPDSIPHPAALASDVAGKISATGYSATASGNVVTITGPSGASGPAGLTPVVTMTGKR